MRFGGLSRASQLAIISAGIAVVVNMSLAGCMKQGTKTASGIRSATEKWKATPAEVQSQYPPNKTIIEPIKFVITTKEGSPVPNVNVDFKAFDVTPAFNAGTPPDAMKAEILSKWSDGNFVMDSKGSVTGNSCDAGFTREICTGLLSGPSKVTNQNGEATVGFTTPNAPGGVIAVAVRVPEDSTASDLIEMVLIKITPNDDFANSGIEPLQSALLVIPMLFDNDGRQVIQAGVPFNLAVYAPGIPNTQPGKGFMFDFATEGLLEAADGSTVVVPSGSKRCEFRNSQCIVPGGPFRVLKPTTLSFSAKPTDPKFPVKPSSISLPVITGQASQLIVALSPDTKNIQNACADSDLLNKPCIIMSADDDKKELYPMLLDSGGNWVESPDTVWSDISGPLAETGRIASSTVTTGKQTLYPLKASDPTSQGDTIKVTVKGKSIYMFIKYLVTPGKPQKLKVTNTTQRATVPFPAIMELRDRYGNFCYNFSDQIAMKLSLSPLSDVVVPPLTGLVKTATKVATLDHTGNNKVTFTNGVGRTSEAENTSDGFVVTKVPASTDTAQWPKIAVDEATTSAGVLTLDVDSVPLLINPGPVVQTLWRDTSNGGGISWNEKELDPVTGYNVASDQQYSFYLAGYDAAANFVNDISDAKFWGVNYTLDDKDSSLAATFKAATDRLFTRDPSAYSSFDSCQRPEPKTPYAGRPRTGLPPDEQAKEDELYGMPTNQPESNTVYCGIHLGLSNRGGFTNVAFNSKGIAGTGRILAIPNGMYGVDGSQIDYSNVLIKPALSPKLTLVAGAASKFAFEFVSAEESSAPGTVIYRVGQEDQVPTGHKFKIRVHAQDSEGTDAPTYTGIKTLQVRFTGEKSWGGIVPILPSGEFQCEFGKEIAGVCEIPGTYMLADARTSALLAVKQVTLGGVQGTFAKIIVSKVGVEKRLFFADKKGGPDMGAVVENTFQYPLGRSIKADNELPLAVAVTDAGGSYIRDAVAGDGLVYDGFRSDDGSFRLPTDASDVPPVFAPETGAWRNASAWNTSYNLYDVFTADSSDPLNMTPLKFYNPDYTGTPQQITNPSSTDLNKYNTVFVPQNRFGKGFAVPRSSTKPELVGWPSSWWSVSPGDPEHIETRLVRSGDPEASWTKPGYETATAEQKTNWVSASDTCYDVVITIHDKKHNQLANYTGVVPNVVFKMINTTTDKPNGVDDLQAGIFAENYRNKLVNYSYYQPHNQVFVPGPFRDGFYLLGTSETDGGLYNFSRNVNDPAVPSLNDWLIARVTVTTGVITTGVQACLYNGQTQANRTAAVPYLEKFIQVDMPSFTTADGKTTFPAFQSRGAGITFTGADNKQTGSSASPHTHEDKLTVFRSTAHHLHPTFNDSVTHSDWDAYYASARPVVGVSDRCYAYQCGRTEIYWHEHDISHNFIRPARTDGFQTSSELPSGAKRGANGAMGSPSSLIFDVGDSRLIPVRPNAQFYDLRARNNFVNWLLPGANIMGSDYRYGAGIALMAGPPKTMEVSRLGASSLTTDSPFGLHIGLFDEFGNASGAQQFSRGYSDQNGNFGIDRSLEVRFDQQPSNGPTGGKPRLMGLIDTNLADASSPVTRLVQPAISTNFIAKDFAASNDADNILLVKANESRNLLLTLKDSITIPWCKADAMNCCFDSLAVCQAKKDSPRSISATFPVNAQAGLAKGTVLTLGTGTAAIQYPAQGSADPLTAYNAIFNTNPTAGETYPLGASLTRTFKTNACSTDQYGNIGECDSNAQFYIVDATNPSPLDPLSSMLNVSFFNWRATKPGTFALKAIKNGFTGITAPISVASKPLNAFSFENVTTTEDVQAGSEFQVKVCMIDEAKNVITSSVFNDQGQKVTDPEATLPVGFSLFGLTPNPEGKSLQLSTGSGSEFSSKKIDLSGASLKFTQGCTNLYAQIYAKGTYNKIPLITMSYIDPMQENKPFSGSGFVVNSVLPVGFDHYGTKITGAPVLLANSVVPALSNPNGPGTNISANTAGGNRFDLTVYARDIYGNDIAYSGNFTVALQLQTASSEAAFQLTCAAPANDSACVNQSMNGSAVTISNLAIDVPGDYYVLAKNTNGSGLSLANSAGLRATASIKTIKEYVVGGFGPGATYLASNGPLGFTVTAVDNKGNAVQGIASEINSQLGFSWVDEAGQPLSGYKPPYAITNNARYTGSCVPQLNAPVFDNYGVAKFGNQGTSSMKLTKSGPVKINLRDSQTPSVVSNNANAVDILPDGITYDVTCTKVSNGADCTGTQANPVLMDASPENRFNLTVKSVDICGNTTVSPYNNQSVYLISSFGGTDGFGNIYNNYLEWLPSEVNVSNWHIFNGTALAMAGQDQRTFSNLFSRGIRNVEYSINDPMLLKGTTTVQKTYHNYRPTIATVSSYRLANLSKTTAKTGEAITFNLQALDGNGNPVSLIDSQLNAQKYTWAGGGIAPNGEGPVYPTPSNPSTNLSFTNGATGPLSVVFKKTEQVTDFYVTDDFVPGASGVLMRANAIDIQAPADGKRRSIAGYPIGKQSISVVEGLPAKFALSSSATTVKAGSPFDVALTVYDKFNNLATTYGSDTLTFVWTGASSSVGAPTNPVTAAVKPADVLAQGSRTFDPGTATFATTGTPFTLYRSNANASAPQEQPVLTVTGAKTGAQTETGNPLTASLTFTVQPADTIAYAKIADASTFDATSNFSGKGLSMSNDQTKIFFGHLFDTWGNYKGTSPNIAWTGSSVLAGKLAPTPSLTTTLTPTTAGSGVVTASCSAVQAGCVSDSTGTISINPSPLVSFGVTQVSPTEGNNIIAGDLVTLNVCMLDKNKQVITSPVVINNDTITDPNGTLTGLAINKSINIIENYENQIMDLSLGQGSEFVTKQLSFGANTVTFTNGCFNLYAKVYSAGTYGSSKPLLSLAYTDVKQSNLAVGGSGLIVGTVGTAALDHYFTFISETPSGTGVVPAWADPSANVYASAGGNRFTLEVRPIDGFGNLVAVTKSVTLGLVKKSDLSAVSNLHLRCSAPNNNQSCLTASFSNSAYLTVPFAAIDIPGDFYISATDGSKSWSTTRSISFTAVPSAKTVKYYAVTSPTTAIAGQEASIKVEARDSADQVITGADADLKSLAFSWVDGSNISLTTGHVSPAPSSAAPILPASSLPFGGGVATVGLTLTKAESGLQINVKDNQTAQIASTNTTSTTVSPGTSLYYAITCSKVTGGADCSGTSAGNAASMLASPSDMFNLQLKAFDQYQNPKSDGATSPAIKLTWESGNDALNAGRLEQSPIQNVLDATYQVLVPMTGKSQTSVLNLFHRAGAHVLSMSVDPASANYVGMSQKTFHSYQAHIDMVGNYDFSPGFSQWTNPIVAGTAQNFTLRAYDKAGNLAKGIDPQLNAQRYLWKGPTAAPNGDAPVLPGPMTGTGGALTFSGGQITGLSATFKNAESLADFYVMDNYVPGASGVGGEGPGGTRRSAQSGAPLMVINATPSEYVLSTDSTTIQAGTKFDVKVLVRDQFQNPAKTWTSDNLTFSWLSGASSTPSNPSSAAMSADVSPAGLKNFAVDTATYLTTDQRFVLYKAPEPSVLKVTGQTPRATGQAVLTGTLAFTPTVSTTPGYVKIASSATYDGTTTLSGVGFSMATNDSKSLYAHLFDPFGNYSGNTSPVSWSGTDKLANKMTPTSAAVTTLTATEVGTGYITASCTALNANCKPDTTGIVSVGASPLKEFVVEHTGTGILAQGGTVPAGTEIPMRVCMLDKAGNRITQDVYVDGVLKTQAGTLTTPVSIPLTFSDLNVQAVKGLSIDYSTGTGATYDANKFGSGAVSLPFKEGCAAFNARLFATATYNSAALLNITHTAALQGNITILGTGLKIQAVTPLGLDHFRPIIQNAASTPQANSVPAWGIPGPNVYAKDGGSKFDVRVYAEDMYNNSVTVSNQSVTLSTYAADRVTPRTRTLICPGKTYGDTSCLTQSLTGSNIVFSNLAIDVGGFTFYPYATSGSIGSVLLVAESAAYAVSSEKTVAQYVVTAPTSVTAGSEFTVGIAAKDATGANVQGADSALSGLTFSWLDGATPTKLSLSTHTAPGGQAPTGVSAGALSFSGGSASQKMTLTKVETGLKINVADSQSTSVTSNTTATTDVGVGGQTWYDITCSRVSDSTDCTGTSSTPVAMTGSAVDKYNLTIKVYDQYKNPKTITANPQLQVTRISGASATGTLEQYPLVLSTSYPAFNLIVPMSGVNQTTVSNLFRRSASQSVSIGIAAASTTVDGTYSTVYHSYSPTIDSVAHYYVNGFTDTSITAGSPYTVTVSAVDSAGNPVGNIASALNQQSYYWTGVGVAPNGQAPVLPGVPNGNTGPNYPAALTFDNTGTTGNMALTFYKAETLIDTQFTLKDNYNGTGGNGGWYGTPYRWANFWGNKIVTHAKPSQYVVTADTTTPAAGSGFDVTVKAYDDYLNPATAWATDNLTFAWTGASNSITNPKTAAVLGPSLPTTNPVTATFTNGSFTTSGAPFKLYRSNLYSLTPQEVSTLTVTGSVTSGTKSGTALSKTLNFTTQPASTVSYVKIANDNTYSDTTSMSGKALNFTNNQTLNLYAHVFDAYGNYKGSSTIVGWSGSGALSTNVSPTTGYSTVVSPAATGTGKVTANCSSSISGCIDDMTGTIGVKSAPLASFLIAHASTPAEGDPVTAGTEIPLQICMRDSKNQIITQTVVDANNNTITDPNALLTLSFAAINFNTSVPIETNVLDLSTLGGGSYSGAPAGARAVQFASGCANFFAKVYQAGPYGATLPLLSVTYSDPNQQGITISGSGLKIASAAAKALDHYVTTITGLSNNSTPNTTQAWASPGTTNTYANVGGNRFDVTVYARDIYGNPVTATSQTVNLSLVQSDGATAAGRSLICSATASPANGTSCLSPVITNSNSVTVNALAVDIGGQSFFVKATDGTKPFSSGYSTQMYSATSRRTVKEYGISAPSTAVAGVNTPVTVTALDNSGNTIIGADNDLNANDLVFEWTDGVNLLSTHKAPSNHAPTLPLPASNGNRKFNAGSANINLGLVKAETGLKINIRDNQTTQVSSNNTSTTDVSAGTTLTYALSCLKDTGGAVAINGDCSGTSSTPASILASAADRFRLTIQPYDQYKNPRAGNAAEILQVDLLDGTAGGAVKGWLEQTPLNLTVNGSKDLVVDTSNSGGVTIGGLFHRVGNHKVSYSIANKPSIGWNQIFHTFSPSIDMVYSYDMSSIPANTAGTAQSFTITAKDIAGNVAKNIDSALKAQAFSWNGASASPAPVYPSTTANTINFASGVSDSLNVTFKKAETVGFYVQDSYVPAVSGIGGAGTSSTRRSAAQSIVVSNAQASTFSMTPTTSTPNAGVGFGVTVKALDTFGNVVTNYPSDPLTFAWTNASSTVTNPKYPSTTFSPVTSSLASGTMTNGVFTSSGTAFTVYKTGETPKLTVTGTSTSNTTNAALTTFANFTPAANANHGYVRITSSNTYSAATELVDARDITTDQTATLYAHMFDDYGNWKGNTFNVAWTGSDALSGKLTTPGFTSTLTPTLQGTGAVTADCTGLTAGCVSFTTGLYTVKPGAIQKFVWLSPTPSTINQNTEACQQFTLQAQDNANNPVNVTAATGITFQSTGGDGEFYSSLTECQNGQTGGDSATMDNPAKFHPQTTLSGSNGIRTASIAAGTSTVDVWYANRVITAANGATVSATLGSLTSSRTGQITASAAKRIAMTSSNFSIYAAGTGAETPNCGTLTYKFQDKWGNNTATSANSTVQFTSSSSTTGKFYSDLTCQTQITSRPVGSKSAGTTDSIYYNDSQANTATLTLTTSSKLDGTTQSSLQDITVTATVSPGTFAVNTPANNSYVKDVTNPGTGPAFGWGSSLGARDYTVTYGTLSTCGTQISAATTGTSANLPGNLNGTYYVCLRANGYTGTAPGTPQRAASTDATTYKFVVDNAAPTGSITVPASTITYIGPNTTATHSGAANTTVFAGTAADTTAGVNKVEVTLQRSSDSKYWTGSTWGASTWLLATGTTSWTYAVADSNFADGGYTLTAKVTDNSLNVSTASITKAFTWKGSATSARIASGMPGNYSKWTTLGSPNPGVVIDDASALVKSYTYKIVSGTTCPSLITGYPTTFTDVATKITDSISTYSDGQYTLCVLGKDEAENVQTVGSPTTQSWYKDVAAPTITAMTTQTVNAAYAAAPTVSDNIDTAADLTYAWSFVSSASNRCSGASFSPANTKNTSVSATGCTNSWGAVTVRLTATDRAGNAATSDLIVNWDQQAAYVASITSSLTANSFCRVGYCGATAQASIPISIVFTKDSGNFNRNTFSLTVTGTPTMNLNIVGTGSVTRTATLTAGTYTNDASGNVTVPATYTIQAGDASGTAGGIVLNAGSASPFNSSTSVVDNTGGSGLAISNSGVPTTGTTALSNRGITIDTTAPTASVSFAGGPASTGYVNTANSTSTTALSGAATGVNETTLSSTSVPQYKLIAKTDTCDSGTTGMSTTIPSPSSASMSTLTQPATYVICIQVTDPAGNVGYSKSGDIVLDRTPPVFTSINVPVTSINNTNSSSTSDVGNTLNSSGADAASNPSTYAVTKNTTCDGTITYGAMPKISDMNSDGTWYLCVKLVDIAGNITYGQAASSINRQTVAAQLTAGTFQWTGDAADSYLNILEQGGTGDILTLPTADKAGVTFKYAITTTTATACSALTYSSSTLPAKASFTATNSTYKACVQMTDAVGNLSYYATSDSKNLYVDLTAPTLTYALANAASDSYINATERSDSSAVAMATVTPASDMKTGYPQYSLITSGTTCASGASGSWSTTVPKANDPANSDASYIICAWLQDNAGNPAFSASSTITVKVSQPSITAVTLANEAADGWLNISERLLTNALVSVTSSGATATSYVVVSNTTTCDANAGTYSTTMPVSNSTAINSDTTTWRVCVRVEDAAKNYQYLASGDIKRDTVNPTLGSGFALIGDAASGAGGSTGSFINDGNKAASGAILSAPVATDANTVTYKYLTIASTGTCNAGAGTYTTTLPDRTTMTTDGTYKFCTEMKDAAGNIGYGTSANLVRDTAVPTLAFASGTPSARSNTGISTNKTLNIGISSTDTAKYYYAVVAGYSGDGVCGSATYLGPVAQGTNITTDISGYADGWVTVCARAQDAALNTQTVANVTAYSWTKDTAAPAALTITAPTNVISSTSPTVTWTTPAWVTSPTAPIAADPHTITLKVARDSACTNPTGGSFVGITGVPSTTQTQALSATLADGLWYICMTVTDNALNVTNISGQFEVETDTVHVSYTDNGTDVKYSQKSGVGGWLSPETVATGGGRSSLAIDKDGNPYISYKYYDAGTNVSAMRYRKRTGTNTYGAENTVNSEVQTTMSGVGSFNELAIGGQNSTTPNIYSVFFGYNSAGPNQGLSYSVNTAFNGVQFEGTGVASFKDMAIALGTDNTPFGLATVTNGTNYVLKIQNMALGNGGDVTLPANCADALYVSAVSKNTTNIVAMALACRMSNDNTCRTFYGEATYNGGSFTYSSWTDVGVAPISPATSNPNLTMKGATCAVGDLSENDRPSIIYDRVNGKVSIVWVDKTNNKLYRWNNESGSNANDLVVTGVSTVSQQTIAVDKTGKSYVVYLDGSAVKSVTNNARPTVNWYGSWSSPVTIGSGSGATGVGTIGITGMKGRSNTYNGN